MSCILLEIGQWVWWRRLHSFYRSGHRTALSLCLFDTRPITKIASHKNRATREKNRISAIIDRQKLNEVTSRLNSDGLTAEERAAASSEQKRLG